MENNIFNSYCNAALLLATAIICNLADVVASEKIFLPPVSELERLELLAKNVELDKSICIEPAILHGGVKACISLDKITKKRRFGFDREESPAGYLEFPLVIDTISAHHQLEALGANKSQQRRFLQNAASVINRLSIDAVKPELTMLSQTKNLQFIPIVINNSLFMALESKGGKERGFQNTESERTVESATEQQSVIGIIDSGVSQYHHQLANVQVVQFNPLENSNQVKDTAFGHATAILSLLAVEDNPTTEKRLIENGKYLSCNGLPNAKYSFKTILQCMNWLFLQQRVDVLINAWTVPQVGCINQWRYPLAMLFYANSLPVFAAGNHAGGTNENLNFNIEMNRSPANLNFSEEGFTSLTVGALDESNRRLTSSSFGVSQCHQKTMISKGKNTNETNHFQANLFAKGTNLIVAVPFTKTSFQQVEGTSYAVVLVAAAAANLRREFPDASLIQISQALLKTATVDSNQLETSTAQQELGFGIVNYAKAREYLLGLFPRKTVKP